MKVQQVILIVTGTVLVLQGLVILIPPSWLKTAALFLAERGWFVASQKTVESLWPTSQGFIYALRLSYIAYMCIGSKTYEKIKHKITL